MSACSDRRKVGLRCSDCTHLDHDRVDEGYGWQSDSYDYIGCSKSWDPVCTWPKVESHLGDDIRPFPELIRSTFKSAETCPFFELTLNNEKTP